MKVAVTGASGIQGMSVMIYLLEQDDVAEVQASDIFHLERLQERVQRLNDKRLSMRELDCTDQKAAAEAFKGYDVVINCAMTPGGYLATTEAALEAGCNYLDLVSMGEELNQSNLHYTFKNSLISFSVLPLVIICALKSFTLPGFALKQVRAQSNFLFISLRRRFV